MTTKTRPANPTTLTPGCALVNTLAAMDLYAKVFGAVTVTKLTYPDGSVAHTEMRIGGSNIMMGEASAAMGVVPYFMHVMVYVPDTDATFKLAVENGFTVKSAPSDQFYGDRSARVVDPFGNEWFLATRLEEVSQEEMQTRLNKMMG